MTDNPHSAENLPKSIMVWFGQWPLIWAGTWAVKRYPADAVEYVPRAELERMRVAAQLGLDMARANDLWNTAETIERALEASHE